MVTIGLFILAIGLLFLSRLFIKPTNTGANLSEDDQPTTLAQRGAHLPYPIGERLCEPLFAFADDEGRFSRQENVGGASGGKGKSGGGQASQTVWFSHGLHAFMPTTALKAIYENDKKIWPPEGQPGIDRDTAPSGTLINAGTIGSFVIMWGELDQPVDPILAEKMGIASRWPEMCLVIWQPKRLGTSKTWPQLKYLFEQELRCVETISDPYILDDNEGSRGVNAVHVLLQLLTGEFPFGLGYSADEIDRNSFEQASGICIDEHLAMNLLIRDGDTADKAIQSLLTDIGAMLVDHDGKLMLRIMRPETGNVPVLDDDVIMPPDMESTINTDEKDFDRVVFTFKDKTYNYRDNDIKFDNDGRMEETHRYKTVDIALFGPTDIRVATTIANRRIHEQFGDDGSIKAQALRGATVLLPGSAFLDPEGRPLRVMSVLRDTFSAACTIDCILDSLAVPADVLLIDQGNADAGGPTPLAAAHDLATTFLEVPLPQSGGTCRIAVLRVRAHNQIDGAFIWVSADGASYISVDQQNTAAAGGILEDALPISEADIIEDGPIIEALGPDVGDVRDLTSDPSGWTSGSQLLVINREAFYLRNLTAIAESDWSPNTVKADGNSVIPTTIVTGLRYVCVNGGNTGPTEPSWPTLPGETVVDNGVVWEARGFRYETHGLIRARFGTVKADHEIGDIAFIATTATLTLMTTPIMLPGVQLCMKSQPFTSNFTTDISGAIAVCNDLTGLGMNENFWTTTAGYLVNNTGDRLYFKV